MKVRLRLPALAMAMMLVSAACGTAAPSPSAGQTAAQAEPRHGRGTYQPSTCDTAFSSV